MLQRPGEVMIFGSGEIARSATSLYDWLFGKLPQPLRAAVLETPAGFEPNSASVAGRIADFLREHLQSYQPEVSVVPARKRGATFSPDDPGIVEPLLHAGVILLGPGSPTYAVRQLENSLAWQYLVACHRLGAAIVLSSAGAIAAGKYALPVYEIYKVGAELHWQPGLNFFGPHGLTLVFIPHWNNTEGGADLDTSRCYVGEERFAALLAMLPPEATVVGIDEHTALVVDVASEACEVLGFGGVTALHNGQANRFTRGQAFPIAELGPVRQPLGNEGVSEEVWQLASATKAPESRDLPSVDVMALVQAREATRARHDWPAADRLRERILALGWQIVDKRAGPQLTRREREVGA